MPIFLAIIFDFKQKFCKDNKEIVLKLLNLGA